MGTLAHVAPATDGVACAVCRLVCALGTALKYLVVYVLAALLISFVHSGAAHAQIAPSAQMQWSCGGSPGHGGWHTTPEAAIAAMKAANPGSYGDPSYISGSGCFAYIEYWASVMRIMEAYTISSSSCPANSSLSGSSCTCNSGYTQEGSTCVSNQCPLGQGRTFNRTEGWGRSANADADDLVVSYGAPASVYDYNDGVCVGNIAKVEQCWRSQEPSAQGLYRTSCDYTMVISGDAPPSTGDSAANPETPIPPCPGTLGTVNGKPMCVGTASNPLPSPQAAPNQPTGAGNPSAGVKPSTGPGSGSTGSGRTPSTGNGGNDGGPASSAIGRGGSGQRAEGSETGDETGAVCGAPPLPACNVKVDETGTPNGSTFGTSPELDGALNQREAGLATARDSAGDASWGIVPSWIVDRPCEPWNVATLPEVIGGGAVTLDLCPFKPISDGILNFVWVCYAIFAVTGLVASAMTGKEA